MAVDLNSPVNSTSYLTVLGQLRDNINFAAEGRRNLIINGCMDISQRKSTFTAPSSGDVTIDRWAVAHSGTMVYNVTQEADAPTVSQFGGYIEKSYKVAITTADASMGSTDILAVIQHIEGYNFRRIYQKNFSLSFWVRSSVTGTYCVSFTNDGLDKVYVAEYTINSADTWEYKTITVTSAPSGGTWDFTNGRGLSVRFCLAAGAGRNTTAGSWEADGSDYCTSNQTNMAASVGNDFFFTGVQLEAEVPTAFEQRSIQQELELCQRHYCKSYNITTDPGSAVNTGIIAVDTGTSTTNNIQARVDFPVSMAVTPSVSVYDSAGTIDKVTMGGVAQNSSVGNAGQSGFCVEANNGSGASNMNFHYIADAEI